MESQAIEGKAFIAVGQQWEESEEGWGVRPDGYTLHLSMHDCHQFRQQFWEQQKQRLGEAVPSEYTRESGEPFLIPIDQQSFALLAKGRVQAENLAKFGIWGEGRNAKDIQLESTTIVRTVFDNALVVRASDVAEQDFAHKARKVPAGVQQLGLPYFSHLHAVATCLAEFGYSPEVVAAGYLHDHIEDLPKTWNRSRLQKEFGDRVAELVDWVTQQDKSLPWEARNEAYETRLRNAPREAIAISAADKISNLSDLLHWMRQGYPVESVLKRGWAANSEKFHNLEALFASSIPQPMLKRFSELLSEFDKLGESTSIN